MAVGIWSLDPLTLPYITSLRNRQPNGMMEWLIEVSYEIHLRDNILRVWDTVLWDYGTEAMADKHGAVSLKARINWSENQGIQVR